mgnify:CR=1 FL=1
MLDSQLLDDLIQSHGPALRLFAAQWTQEPDDCVQEAFIALCRQNPLPTNIAAWLHRVTRNHAISRGRRRQRQVRHETRHRQMQPAWFEHQDDVDTSEITQALRKLPDEQREVIVARIWGELGLQEIADVLSC